MSTKVFPSSWVLKELRTFRVEVDLSEPGGNQLVECFDQDESASREKSSELVTRFFEMQVFRSVAATIG